MTRYENAYVGIKRIRTSVILQLLSNIFSVVVVFLAGVSLAISINPDLFDSMGAALGVIASTAILSIVVLILSVIGLILMLMGLSRAGIDNERFRSAFLWVIISFVLQVVASLFSSSIPAQIVTGIDTVSSLTNLVVIVFVVQGIAQLLPELAATSKTIQFLVCVPVIISCIAKIAQSATLAINPSVSTAMVVINLVATIVYFFMYLSILGKAKKLLENN